MRIVMRIAMRTGLPRICLLMTMAALAGHAAEFRAADYGAKGDGKTVNTLALQKVIDAAAKAGKGVVVFAPGVYLSGALFLKSNMEMRLDEGVEIRGVQDLAAYPVMQTRIAGIEMKWPSALLNVYAADLLPTAGAIRRPTNDARGFVESIEPASELRED